MGAFSGRPFDRDVPLTPLDREDTKDLPNIPKKKKTDLYKSGDSCNSLPTCSRLVFLFSGLVVIIFSILLVTRGLTELQTSVDTVHESSIVVQEITVEGRDIIVNGLTDLKNRALDVRHTLVNELNRDLFCPGDPSMKKSKVGQEVQSQLDSAVSSLKKLGDFQDERLTDFEESLLNIQNAARSVERTSDETNFVGWKSMMVVLPFTIITSLLMASAVMALFDVSFVGLPCLIDWFLLPVFIFLISAACVLASFSALVAGANSDSSGIVF